MIFLQKRMPIFYSALILTGVNLLLRLVSTSFQVYLSRRIGAEGIGLLQLVLSVGSLSMTAGIAGIRTTSMYLTAEELGQKRSGSIPWVLSGCINYSLICSCAVSLCVYLAAPAIAENWIQNKEAIEAIRLFALFLPIVCLCGIMTGYFTAANQIGTLAAVEIAEQLCSMVVTWFTLNFWAGSHSGRACQAVVLGSSLGSCLMLICLVLLRMKEKNPYGQKIKLSKRLLDTALPLALADDLKAGISTTENMMVPRRLALYPGSNAPLAEFGAVCGMVFPVLMFPASILFGLAELLIPEIARCNAANSHDRIHYLIRRSLRVTMLYGVTVCGLLFLLAEPICQTLFKNSDAVTYLKWFSLLVPMLYCDSITDAMIKGLGQQKSSVRYNIFTSTMDVVFLFILLPKYGMTGYFISFLTTHFINFILSLRRLLKITHISIPWVIPTGTIISMLLSIAGASFFSDTVLRGIGYPALLWSILCILNVVKQEDFLWIYHLIHEKTPC